MKPVFEVGYVARARGLLGELAIKLFQPNSSALLEVDRVLLRKDGVDRELKLVSARAGPKEIILEVDGVDARDGADALIGATVFVFRADLSIPNEGEYFQGDLIGLTALNEKGEVLGVVEELWAVGPVPNLVIRKGEAELMVPFADEFVPKVEIAKGTVVIRPPEFSE